MENDRCLKCKNYLSDLRCLAFNEIPKEILLDENDHSEPLPNQDNNITFEPIEND
jgi:hypothetical protein